jgi:hypothetical protein
MIEKKLILCGILAIAIGIASIVPMEYMMAAQAQENSQALQAQEKANTTADIQASVQPLFSDVNITYAYCNPNKSSSNDTMTLYGSTIEAVVNFTLAPDALKNADAQVEYYKFAVSSDQGPIFNMGYYIVLQDNSAIVTGMGGPDGTIIFANGLTFNGPSATGNQEISFGCGGQGLNYPIWTSNYTLGYVSHYIFGTDANNLPKAASELRHAKTLYIDVTKICTVTVTGNLTVTTPGSNQILQHIELTNTNDGFVYGAYVQGTIPMPIDTQPTQTTPSTSQAPVTTFVPTTQTP